MDDLRFEMRTRCPGFWPRPLEGWPILQSKFVEPDEVAGFLYACGVEEPSFKFRVGCWRIPCQIIVNKIVNRCGPDRRDSQKGRNRDYSRANLIVAHKSPTRVARCRKNTAR